MDKIKLLFLFSEFRKLLYSIIHDKTNGIINELAINSNISVLSIPILVRGEIRLKVTKLINAKMNETLKIITVTFLSDNLKTHNFRSFNDLNIL